MSDERLVQIAEKLLERSKRGEIEWKETAGESSFSVSFPGYSATITKVSSSRYKLAVQNRLGTDVDSLRASGTRRDSEPFEMLMQLFQVARRVGVGTDQVLEGLLGHLSRKEPPV